MHQLIIHKLGPIQHCELSIKNYTILTGYQASGKSTIAKAIYFFRTLKEDIFQLILRRSFSQAESEEKRSSLRGDFESATRNKFLSTFGTSYSMERDMKVTYHYAEGIEVSVCLTESPDFLSPNYVWVDYSQSIRDLLNKYDRHLEHEQLRQELADLFGDPYETVYIPAGRSILTLLGGQFNYIYSTMDDAQKRLLDSCTRDYMERVLKLRPQFANGLEGLLEGKQIPPARRVLYREAIKLIQKILKKT